jgi:GNAT superfamily N-acetyltransferase
MSNWHSETVTIRRALPSEASILSELAMRSKAHWGYSRDFLDRCRGELSFTEAQIRERDWSFVVAEISGAIVGFYGLRRVSRETFELEALFVDPNWMRKSVGRRLVGWAAEEARELGGRVIAVQSDPYAEGFYVAVGGQITGSRESASIPGRYLPTFEIQLERTDA